MSILSLKLSRLQNKTDVLRRMLGILYRDLIASDLLKTSFPIGIVVTVFILFTLDFWKYNNHSLVQANDNTYVLRRMLGSD
jgi:hypothetical protein